MPKSKEKTPKIKVEKVGGKKAPKDELKAEPKVETPPVGEESPAETPSQSPLEKLQAEAVSLGMPKEDAEKFEDIKLLKVSVNALRAVTASAKAPIIDPVNPKEEQEIEKHWTSKAERQKAYFDSLPQVRILIPCEGKEKPGKVEEVLEGGQKVLKISGAVWSKSFNGYQVVVPKGVYTTVSEAVADNIAQEFNQVQESNARFSIDRLDEKGHPVRERLE